VSPARRERYARITSNLYSAVGGYLGGLLGICAINATLTTIFLVIIRMPFFLPLGILSGFSSLVPYAGPLVAGASITIVALVTGGLWKAAATAIYFVLYGQLEGNVLAPRRRQPPPGTEPARGPRSSAAWRPADPASATRRARRERGTRRRAHPGVRSCDPPSGAP